MCRDSMAQPNRRSNHFALGVGSLTDWVDGQAAFSRNGIAFRRADERHLDVDSFWFDVYYGGDESAIDNQIDFDSLALGPDRLGCDDGPVGTFSDDDGSVHQADIEELAASGVTRGCNPPANDRFGPDEAVTRGQMAAFLTRALGLSPAPSGFADVDGHVFEADVGALAASGVTRGCNPPANDRFCPEDALTRARWRLSSPGRSTSFRRNPSSLTRWVTCFRQRSERWPRRASPADATLPPTTGSVTSR